MSGSSDERTTASGIGGRIGASASNGTRIPRLALGLVAVLVGCAGAHVGRGDLESTIGRATHYDIMTEVPEAFSRHGYAIYNTRDTGSDLYLETGWQERAPFEDEADEGVEYARTRFIARARLSGPAVFTLRITAENQIRLAEDAIDFVSEGGGWSTMPATGMYREYVEGILTEIRLEVDAGLRRYGVPIG